MDTNSKACPWCAVLETHPAAGTGACGVAPHLCVVRPFSLTTAAAAHLHGIFMAFANVCTRGRGLLALVVRTPPSGSDAFSCSDVSDAFWCSDVSDGSDAF